MTDIDKILKKASGRLPSDDKKVYQSVVDAVVETFGIKKPIDIMNVNRLVATWMKMRYIEGRLEHYGLFFEQLDDKGLVKNVKINEMAYYLKQLEAEFRSYQRLLQQGQPKQDTPQDFSKWLEDNTHDVTGQEEDTD